MNWSIRHAGSPKDVDGLSLRQIAEGLKDGEWEIEDEVQGPGEAGWTLVADHPRLEGLAESLAVAAENGERIVHDPEEDRIDMNPLIDVCLVLLVFFILATTMAMMEKTLPLPLGRLVNGPPLRESEARERMLVLEARVNSGRTALKLEGQDVSAHELAGRLRSLRASTDRKNLLIDAKEVNWQTVVDFIGAAQEAGIPKVCFKVDQADGRRR